MRKNYFATILTAVLALALGTANAAALRDVFKRVSGSVVVVMAESRSPGALGIQARPSSADSVPVSLSRKAAGS